MTPPEIAGLRRSARWLRDRAAKAERLGRWAPARQDRAQAREMDEQADRMEERARLEMSLRALRQQIEDECNRAVWSPEELAQIAAVQVAEERTE